MDSKKKNGQLRKEAKAQGLSTYIAITPCQNGHYVRYTCTGSCKICMNDYSYKWRKENKERFNAYHQKYRDEHREKLRAYMRIYNTKRRKEPNPSASYQEYLQKLLNRYATQIK